ncbi:MAG: hypothetical protein JWM91_4825 [Rhodospirillales bacterium]|nr:hypothetical protein [Rhodospirillales bacterium]
MTVEEALAFIKDHGVVLASANGPVPRMADIIAGEPVKGSWWKHPKGHEIFSMFAAVADSPDILACRLVGGKVTYVHRRVWPALIRAAEIFPAKNLARVDQEHTAAGHHVNREVPFPEWADADSMVEAMALSEDDALSALGPWAVTQRPQRSST